MNWRLQSSMGHWRRFVMSAELKRKSRLLEAAHETAQDLHRWGFIDKRKMDKFDALCIAPVADFDSAKIRDLRQSLQLSQAVL
jgi:putative transcriptional regulator